MMRRDALILILVALATLAWAQQPVNTIRTDTAPATQTITAQDTASTATTVANSAVFITGAPTAGSAASFPLASGFDSVDYEVTGTWTGTLAVEASMDGATTWVSVGIHQEGTSYVTNGFTGNFIGEHNAAGYTNVRVRSTAAWTGTATIRVTQTVNSRLLYVVNPLHIGDGVTQSTITTVKAASTAAGSTDTALVVAISPNNTVGATQSGTWNVTNTGTFAVQAAQSGSWSINANAGTNLNTSALALESGGNLATLASTVSSSKVNVNLSSSTLPTSVVAGQQAVTASAAALASNALTRGFCVQALSTNSISVYLGPSGVTTSTGLELPAGASFCPAVSNSNEIYVIATATGATVTWSGD